MKILKRSFYERNTLTVAKELLGKYLVRNFSEGKAVGKIVETEAYVGSEDAASHAYNNLLTARTRIQFGRGGYAYVYQIWGIHFCFNVVTEKKGRPAVVLIRSLEPIEGLQLMAKRRKININQIKDVVSLCNGPGKLCIAMDITKKLNGEDLLGDKLFLVESGEEISKEKIISTPRININYAGEARKYPWRFIIKDNFFVSRTYES